MSIYRRGGVWWVDFKVHGKRYRQSTVTNDRREALRLEKELISKATEGRLAAPGTPFFRLNFGDAMAKYLDERKPRLAAKTIQTETERSRILAPRLGSIPLKNFTSELVFSYQLERKREGKSNGTINLELRIIRGVLKRAKMWAVLADDVHPLPVRKEFGRALLHEEKVKLERIAAQRPGWQGARLAMTLSLNTTMRASEIRSLRWRDVDFIERLLTVHRSKTEAGERVIPLNATAFAAMLELRERAKLMFGDVIEPSWYLFPRAPGATKPDPTRPATSWRTAWRLIIEKAGLSGFRFHDLRHHAITELAESAAGEQTIMAIAGHISRKMLERYSHARINAKRAALDRLSQSHVTVVSQRLDSDYSHLAQVAENVGGADGTRTRDLLRDRQAF